jgi:AcrR family transcriptional regulator
MRSDHSLFKENALLTSKKNGISKEFKQLRADAVRNRTAILAAATGIFEAKGPDLSTEAVARSAGVGVGTVFRHFSTKEDLLEAIVATRLKALTDEANALGLDDQGEALFLFFERIVQQSASKRSLVHTMSALGMNVAEVMRDAGAGFRAAMSDLLDRAQKERIVRPDVTVADVLDLLRAIAYTAELGTQGTDRQSLALTVVLDGLRFRDGSE